MQGGEHERRRDCLARSSKPRPPNGRGYLSSAGFTLVEVLVAFAILAAMTIVVQRGVSVALGGIARTEERLGAELVARALMSGPLDDATLAKGGAAGRLGDFDWAIRLEPLPLPPAVSRSDPDEGSAGSPPTVFVPLRMTVDVSPAGARRTLVTIATVRVVGLAGS